MKNRIGSKRIKVGGLDVRYLTGGEGDPLVIVHGGGSAGASDWIHNAEELAKHYRMFIPDLPGFGHSESIGHRFHFSTFAQFIHDFSHSLGLTRFHLVGHSIGGGIALQYALDYPERVKRLVLVSSLCLGTEITWWVRFLSAPAFSRSLGELTATVLRAAGYVARWLYGPLRFINPLPRIAVDMGHKITTLRGQTTVLLDRLSEVVMPTLLVWGTRDGIVPAHHAYAAVRLLPDGQVHLFEGSGHSVYRERSQEFSRLLASFLNETR